MYNKYMADNNVNISEDAYLVLKNLYTAGTLVNPPDNARREEVRLAWTRAYNEAKSMFKQQMPEWVRSLRLDDDNSTLLCDVLQT